MKKFALVVALIAATLSIQFTLAQSPSPTASVNPSPSVPANGGGPRCGRHSRNVQLFSFYGTKDIVTHHLAHLPVNLSERRMFLQITQGIKTDIRLFEHQDDGSFKVTEWAMADAPGLFAEIDKTITKNKGENCVGEAVKDLLHKFGSGKMSSSLPGTVSPEQAFTPSVQGASEGPDDFIKGTVVILC